jgi:zinc D-Ala-D-Ala carboxypeptidase
MDLDAVVSQHAKNFTWREMFRSEFAARHRLDNVATDPAILENIRHVAERVLQPIRDHFGIAFSPNSVYRSPAVNTGIGGSATSQHMKGEAADIAIPGISNHALALWIESKLRGTFDQLILEMYTPGAPNSGWVHCSTKRSGDQRSDVKTYTGTRYLPGLVA